jgi:hypothetical protein
VASNAYRRLPVPTGLGGLDAAVHARVGHHAADEADPDAVALVDVLAGPVECERRPGQRKGQDALDHLGRQVCPGGHAGELHEVLDAGQDLLAVLFAVEVLVAEVARPGGGLGGGSVGLFDVEGHAVILGAVLHRNGADLLGGLRVGRHGQHRCAHQRHHGRDGYGRPGEESHVITPNDQAPTDSRCDSGSVIVRHGVVNIAVTGKENNRLSTLAA